MGLLEFFRKTNWCTKIIQKNNTKANKDQALFDKFVENNPVSYFSHKNTSNERNQNPSIC